MSVEEIYNQYAGEQGDRLRELRALVLQTAAETEGVGGIDECLKWGQPSFVTVRPKCGSTIRVDKIRDSDTKYAMYFICSTNLVDRFREMYPDAFTFEGNRALIFDVAEALPKEELKHCIAMALTYKLKR